MTDYSDIPTVATGDWIDAAWINQYLGDNFRALWPYTTAGDLAYASSAVALARLALVSGGVLYGGASSPAYLAKPADPSVLAHLGADYPEYVKYNEVGGMINAIAIGTWTSAKQTSAPHTTWVDLASVNLVTTKTCTVVMMGMAFFAILSAGHAAKVTGSIGGTQDTNYNACTAYSAQSIDGHPGGYVWLRTGVSAGTIACKMVLASGDADTQANSERGQFVALALVE